MHRLLSSLRARIPRPTVHSDRPTDFARARRRRVKSDLLSPIMEQFLLKMNWKKRLAMRVRIEKRAKQFDVEIPKGFASFHVRPRSKGKHLLSPTLS